MKHLVLLALIPLLVLTILSAGCSGSVDVQEETEAPSEVVAKVATQAPTATLTPKPSPTTKPTRTQEPSPMPTLEPTETPKPTPTPEPELMVMITDDVTGEPIAGATVELIDQMSGQVYRKETNDDGEILFTALPAGDFNVSIAAAGYYDESNEEISVIELADATYTMTKLAVAEIVNESSILRAGPGTAYSREAELAPGEIVEIVNQNEEGDWFLVAYGEEDETAWVSGEDVSVSGGIERVEVVEAPPTPTPRPTSAPEATEESEEAESVVIYYLSNPNEILGVFPVRPFDPAEALSKMQIIRGALYTMRDALPGARGGDAAACTSYINAYNNILYSGVYYEPVPPEWQSIDEVYYLSFVYALDRTRPAYLSCVDAGRVDDFNAGLAETSIGETLGILEPAINEAAARQ